MSHNISFSTFLFAPPDEVMELLTNPEFIEEWSGAKAVFEKRTGGKFEMFDGWAKGEILELGETELSYSWLTGDWEEGTAASIVKYKLEPVEHGTEVYVEHTGLPSEEEAEAHKKGWKTYFFDPIGEYLSYRNF
jgi:uncharacterized protein YndB with AHSA1/START domain